MEEEKSGSNEHIDKPKAFFIFHNIPQVIHTGYWAIPPMSENPVEHLDSTYRYVVDAIFTSLLIFLGRFGSLYINLRGQGYLQIRPPRVFWDVDSFREILSSVLSEHRVPQENDAIVWHRTNLQALFNHFPRDRRVIGCLLDVPDGNRQEINIHDFLRFLVPPSENLVFVVGDFRNYRDLEKEIDQYVKVSDPGTPTNSCVQFICQECQRRWNLI